MKKVKVDKNKCLGCGTCVAICPEVFELGEDGKARVKLETGEQRLEASIKEAIESCPVKAISFTS